VKKLVNIMLAFLIITVFQVVLFWDGGGQAYAATNKYVIKTVAGDGTEGDSGDGGPATSAQLHWPSGVAVDSNGNLFITDYLNHRVRKVDTSGNISSAVAYVSFSGGGIALDSIGNIYVPGYTEVTKIDRSGRSTTVAGTGLGGPGFSGDGGPATSAQLNFPEGLAVDSGGNLYIADTDNHRIRKVDTTGTISTVAGTGTRGSSGSGGAATSAELSDPVGVALDSNGNLYIADSYGISQVDTSGNLRRVRLSKTFGGSTGIAIDSSGNLYFLTYDKVWKIDMSKAKIVGSNIFAEEIHLAGTDTPGFSGDGGPSTSGQLDDPVGIAVDSNGNLYIADFWNNRIRILVPCYDVAYDGNGSTGGSVPASSLYEQGATAAVSGNTGNLVKTGYTFAGWNTVADGSGTTYASDGTGTFVMGASDVKLFAKWLSTNAMLSSLSVDQGTLSPSFSVTELNYGTDVPHDISSLNLFLTKMDVNQTLTVTGATYNTVTGNVYAYSASSLMIGSNPIQIEVTAQDGTANTYSVIVNRAAAASGNADLSGLSLSSGALNPIFTPETTTYTSSVPNGVSSLTVTASVDDRNATLTVNGISTLSGESSSGISLNVGSNLITIVVTAQNGTTKTYIVTVTREAPAPSVNHGGSATSSATTCDNILSSENGHLSLPACRTGKVSLGKAATVFISAGATNKDMMITIKQMTNTQDLLTNKEMPASPVFEILNNVPEDFTKPATLTFEFDPTIVKNNQTVGIFYYDEAKKLWEKITGSVINGNQISVDVYHLPKYISVFVVDQMSGKPSVEPPTDTNSPIHLTDIAGHWAEANIKQAASNGMVSGYSDGTFQPDRSVTRAEFTVMLMNVLKPQSEGVILTFADKTNIGEWAQKAVAQAVEAGIITGYEDGSFRPDAEITRLEMAFMLAKVTGQSSETQSATGFADDSEIPVWAKSSIAYLKQTSILQGKGNNRFAPQDRATRAESVTVLLNMLTHKSK